MGEKSGRSRDFAIAQGALRGKTDAISKSRLQNGNCCPTNAYQETARAYQETARACFFLKEDPWGAGAAYHWYAYSSLLILVIGHCLTAMRCHLSSGPDGPGCFYCSTDGTHPAKAKNFGFSAVDLNAKRMYNPTQCIFEQVQIYGFR